MDEMTTDLEEVQKIELEIDAKKAELSQAKADFTNNHCPYKTGDVMVNDLDWCYSYMGKDIIVRQVHLLSAKDTSSGEREYGWCIFAAVLNSNGTPSQRTVKGRKPLIKKEAQNED